MLTERIRANPSIPAAEWPFKPSPDKQPDHVVISTIPKPRLKVKWCDQERQQRSAQTMMLWRWRQRSAA